MRRIARHQTKREGKDPSQLAINDVFSVLGSTRRDETETNAKWQPRIYLCVGNRIELMRQTGHPDGSTGLEVASRMLEDLARNPDDPIAIGLIDDSLVVRVAQSAISPTGYVAVISREDIAVFLGSTFPQIHLPPALQRLLVLHLAGIGLKVGAQRDNRSVETRKRQSQQLRAAFDTEDLATIGRQVSNALVLALDRIVHPQHSTVSQSMATYVNRYLPAATRIFTIADRAGGTVPVLDMGPVGGQPVLTLHAMALPDIRHQDTALLHDLGLRLIWPLRHGTCTPEATALPHHEHVEQALNGASVALQVLCGGRAPVLAFAAASKLGIELARRHPTGVLSLHVAGVCVREGRPETGPRRLARGVMALAASRPTLLEPILDQFAAQLRPPDAFEAFMKRQFAASPADLAIIETEAQGPFGLKRFQDALLDSVASVRHDFLFQNDLGWERSPADLPIHLHHGEMDCIHPMALIEALEARLPNAMLHRHGNVGQLFCNRHFAPLWSIIANGTQHVA